MSSPGTQVTPSGFISWPYGSFQPLNISYCSFVCLLFVWVPLASKDLGIKGCTSLAV